MASKQLKDKCAYYLQTRDLSIFNDEERSTLHIWSQTDCAGAEALIVAYLCKDGDFRQLFINNIKPHVFVGAHLFSEIWRKKIREIGTLGDIKFDMDLILNSPIRELKSVPYWKELENLVKDSDNWSLEERYYYLAKQTCHCVDEETEVLTKVGWRKIGDTAKIGTLTEEIAVVDFDRNIFFEVPKVWNKIFTEDTLYRFSGEETDQLVTGLHTIVYHDNNKLNSKHATDLFRKRRINIPTSGYYKGGTQNLSDWNIKLLVAIQADGYWYSEQNVRFRFVKQRKIDRLLSILKEGNIEFEERDTDVHEIIVKNIKDILSFFTSEKTWHEGLLNWSYNNLVTFINELKYWDGSYSESPLHKREEYISKHSKNCHWVKTICHLIGRQGTILIAGDVFKVGINNRYRSIVYRKTAEKYKGFIYCPTTSTGMFLIKRKGKISITGNSANYGITAEPFRMNILEKSGGKIVVSKAEADRFLITYHSLFPEIRDWHRRLRSQVEMTNIVYNLHGHPLTITWHEIPEQKWKEVIAIPPQSTVGMITNIAFSKLSNEYPQWDTLINGHDSVVSQCLIGEEVDLVKAQKNAIEQEFISPVDGVKFRMKSETQIGFNLAPFKRGKDGQPDINILGLREIKL